MRAAAQAASHNVRRNHGLPWHVLPLVCLPALSRLPGHTAAHEARCPAVGNCFLSAPISARRLYAFTRRRPGTCIQPLPEQEPVMGRDLAFQRQAERRDLSAQCSLGQFGQFRRILFAPEDGLQHRSARDAHNIGSHHAQFQIRVLQRLFNPADNPRALLCETGSGAREFPQPRGGGLEPLLLLPRLLVVFDADASAHAGLVYVDTATPWVNHFHTILLPVRAHLPDYLRQRPLSLVVVSRRIMLNLLTRAARLWSRSGNFRDTTLDPIHTAAF